MGDYAVKRFGLDAIAGLEPAWDVLYRGADMTYNQSFSWYRMLTRFTPTPKGVDAGFFLVERLGEPVLIAPLWIITRRIGLYNAPGVYFIGHDHYTDYLNFIYDRFDPLAVEALVRHIHDKYGDLTWHFEILRETSATFGYLSGLEASGRGRCRTVCRTQCAAISLPTSMDEYLKGLKRNVRGRISTSLHRCEKDGIRFEVCFDNFDKKDLCVRCYERRNKTLRRRAFSSMSLAAKCYFTLKDLVHDRWLIRFPRYMPLVDDPEIKVAAVVFEGYDDVAAFISYALDLEHGRVQVCQVAFDERQAHYSPGMICARFLIQRCIEVYGAHEIDFTRGNEKYKYDLGGVPHYLSSLLVDFVHH